ASTVDLSGTGATGGTTVYSSATVAIGTSVTAVNDAPTASGTATLTAVAEDTTSPGGGTVSALLSSTFGDATDQVTGGSSADSFAGVAIVGNAATSTQGVWQYNSGSGWTDIGTRADGNALVLSTSDQLRFVPASNWNGTAGSLSFRTVDDSAGAVTGGSSVDLSGGGATGGTTIYSATTATLGTSVTAVNDAPTATGDAALTVAEDNSSSSGSTVTALFGGKFSDATDAVTGGSSADSFAGVAIVGNAATSTQGVWQYNDGSGWTDIGTRADGNALLLKASDSIRFVPAANFNGSVGSLTYRTIDSSSGAVTTGTQDLSSSTGGTTAFSANTKALTGSVTAVNDAPVASGSATLTSVPEDASSPGGATL
ncbi:hypothetical protein SAMN06265365_1911, partial [Tistlia consotensis]